MITRLNTVNIYVTEQVRTLHFFRDGLGFAVLTDQSMDNVELPSDYGGTLHHQ